MFMENHTPEQPSASGGHTVMISGQALEVIQAIAVVREVDEVEVIRDALSLYKFAAQLKPDEVLVVGDDTHYREILVPRY